MPLFEDERWEVTPQLAENVRRGEAISHVGYLITAVADDGTERELVHSHGIGADAKDLVAARLFAASKDMFNAAQTLIPLIRNLNLDPRQEEALAILEAAVGSVTADLPREATPERAP